MKMSLTKRIQLSLFFCSVCWWSLAEEAPGEIRGNDSGEHPSENSETPLPEERPRLFQPTGMHPYATAEDLYFDPWFSRGYYPYHGYGYTYGYGMGYHGWGGNRYGLAGFGYRSRLFYDTFYGMLPAPGHTELSMSIGSDDYFGTSISTSTYLSKKHNIVLNIGALWETGEQWWNGQDYESFTIAPTLYWSNENTLIYASFQYSERNYTEPRTNVESPSQQTTVEPRNRQRISPNSSSSEMSPFRNQIASLNEADIENRMGGFGYRTDTDHSINSATIGIDHQFTDSFRIGLNFEARDFDQK